MLTREQQDGLTQCQAALLEIHHMQCHYNAMRNAHKLPIDALVLPALGLAMHKVEGAFFEVSCQLEKRQAREQIEIRAVA